MLKRYRARAPRKRTFLEPVSPLGLTFRPKRMNTWVEWLPKRITTIALPCCRATLDLLILKTLVLGPCHGQGVARLIQRQSEEVFLVDHGSLYVALQRLEDKKWISAKWGVSENNRKARFLFVDGEGARAACGEDRRVAAADAGDGFDSGTWQRAAGRGGVACSDANEVQRILRKRSRRIWNSKPMSCGMRA